MKSGGLDTLFYPICSSLQFGTFQVEYSKHSKRWRMDDLYYAFEETVPAYANGDTEVAVNASATVCVYVRARAW